jgi:ABC-type uncharacterized transport system involved in gliding motility auxiliary subunit
MTGLAALFAGLGIVTIGFGVLSALMALVQPYTDRFLILGNIIIGVVLLGAAIFMSLDSIRERIHSGGTRRAGRHGSSAIVSAVLGIVILGFLGFLSTRYSHRFDVSEAGVHTMAPQSMELLEALEQNVSITAFFTEAEAPPIRDLLDRYAYGSERIKLRFIDPNASPGLVEELGITSEDLARGIARFSLDSGEALSLSEFSEPDVTNALRKLVMSTGKTIYFLEGHNERPITPRAGEEEAFASGPDEFGRAADALRNETYQVEPLLLTTLSDVPADASAVVVAGPTRPLLASELSALERYVVGGGALFVAIDPRAQTNVFGLLEDWDIHLGDDVVVDQALAVYGQATTPIAGEYDGRHPITAPMREPTLFPVARSVEPGPDSDYSILVKTGPESWAERDLDAWRDSGRAEFGANDLAGPVSVAIAGVPRASTPNGEAVAGVGRVVVFGDSDFASNEFFDALRNRDLFINSINWLAGDVEQITVRPNVSRASSFQMSQEEFRAIQYLSLFVLPEAIAIFGVVTWWLRRKSSGRAGASKG